MSFKQKLKDEIKAVGITALSVVQRHLGKGALMRIFMSSLAEEKKTEQPDTKRSLDAIGEKDRCPG